MKNLKVGDKILFRSEKRKYEKAKVIALSKRKIYIESFFGYNPKRDVAIIKPNNKDEYIEVDLDDIVKYDWAKK